VDRVECSYLDESALAYEAARLAHHEAVFACYFEGDVPQFVCVKGSTPGLRYLRGETDSLDFEAVFVDDAHTATALREAFKRLERPALRLVR
jgi:hypothetical protein